MATAAFIVFCAKAGADQLVGSQETLLVPSPISPAPKTFQPELARPSWIDGYTSRDSDWSIPLLHGSENGPAAAGTGSSATEFVTKEMRAPAIESGQDGRVSFGTGSLSWETEHKLDLTTFGGNLSALDGDWNKRPRISVPFLGLSISSPFP